MVGQIQNCSSPLSPGQGSNNGELGRLYQQSLYPTHKPGPVKTACSVNWAVHYMLRVHIAGECFRKRENVVSLFCMQNNCFFYSTALFIRSINNQFSSWAFWLMADQSESDQCGSIVFIMRRGLPIRKRRPPVSTSLLQKSIDRHLLTERRGRSEVTTEALWKHKLSWNLRNSRNRVTQSKEVLYEVLMLRLLASCLVFQ